MRVSRELAENELNVQRELASKADNHTVSYKHRTSKTLIQIE